MHTNKSRIKKKLLDCIDIKRVVQIADELIAIESENPPGNEAAVARYIFDFFAGLGYRPEKQFCGDDRYNVIVRIDGDGNLNRTVMYSGHMDVVPAGAVCKWVTHPYNPVIRDGRLYGRGSSDMKGSIACAMYAAELLTKNKIRLDGCLLYVFDVDEEHSNSGLEKFLSNPVRADFVIVGEPTGLKIAVGHRGVMAFTVTVRGKSVHAAQADKGLNSIYCSAVLIERIQALNAELSHNEYPYLGKSSVNVTMIQGGTKVNTVPDRCVLRIDRRLVKGENRENCAAQMEMLLKKLSEDTGCRCDLEITTYCPCGLIDGNLPEVNIIKGAITEALGTPPVITGFEASCEAGMFIERLGIPAVAFGPGNISEAHNTNEYITLEQLEKGAKAYCAVIMDLLMDNG